LLDFLSDFVLIPGGDIFIILQERKMVIYAESSAVDDPMVLKDEKFAAVRSQICIFKEGELLFFMENKNRVIEWY